MTVLGPTIQQTVYKDLQVTQSVGEMCNLNTPLALAWTLANSTNIATAMSGIITFCDSGTSLCPGNGLVGVNKPQKKGSPKANQSPVPKIRVSHTPENNNQRKTNQTRKRVNPQPWSTTGRTTGPYQPGGGPRSLSPPRCRRSTQGFGDAHSRRDGTQNLEPKHHRSVTNATSLMMM